MIRYKSGWAIVTAGNERYIGNIVSDTEQWLTLCPVYDLCIIQIPTRSPSGGIEGLNRTVQAYPPGATIYDATVHVKPSAVVYLDELHELDKKRYMSLVEDAKRMSEVARAELLGIEVAAALPRNDSA